MTSPEVDTPRTSAAKVATARECVCFMAGPLSARRHADGFDDVAQISGRVPTRLERLRLTAIAGGARLQIMDARGKLDGQFPLAERIVAEILAELGWCPGLAIVERHGDLLDALAAVESDPF